MDQTIVETVLRLESFDLSRSARAKAAVGRFLKANPGSDQYMRLVRRFKLVDETETLIRLAAEKPGESIGPRAVKLLAELQQSDRLKKALRGELAPGLLLAIGRGGTAEMQAWILEMLTDNSQPLSDSAQKAAIQILAERQPKTLLELVKKDRISREGRSQAIAALMVSPDTSMHEAAHALQGGKKIQLAPLAELVKKRGDAANGQQVYGRVCAACHLPSSLGIDFGPNLSEIGSKLSREAMIQSILQPEAAISFGYETTVVTQKDGGQLIGFVVSDADNVLSLRIPGGVTIAIPRESISKSEQNKTSLMPAGLEQTMTEAELIDLVEYLMRLKAKP